MKMAVFALLIPAVLIAAASAADEGEYKRWKLEFSSSNPDYVVLEDALGGRRLCWYVTYKVTNKTAEEVPLRIKLSGVTDTDQKYRDSISPTAQKKLQEKTGKEFKNALAMNRGTIAAGATIDAVAFFGSLDANWDRFDISVAGLYDTIDKVNGKIFYEKKVLVLTYDRPGDEFNSADDEITFKGKKWILDGERREIPQAAKE